jgi:rhodanese-related sulfurtransferase
MLGLAKLPFRVARKLARIALSMLRGEPDAPPPPPAAAPPPAVEPKSKPPSLETGARELLARVKGGERLTFVDVREAAELASTGKIEGALHIPLRDLPRRFAEIPTDAPIVMYCARGMRSMEAVRFLRDKGVDSAIGLSGGLPSWTGNGGDVVSA